jgi:membrane-bound lytic murein transglycosylase D
MNGLSKRSYIYPGQIIRVPTKSFRKSRTKRQTKERSVVPQKKDIPPNKSVISRYGTTLWKKYTVKPGDSLWDIAKVMGVSADQLQKINHMNNPRLQPGQVLFVPQTKSQKNIDSSVQTNDHQSAIARIRQLKNQQLDIDYYYKVKAGDTLESIAKEADVPLERIAAINHMTDDLRVYDGQVLRIPKK